MSSRNQCSIDNDTPFMDPEIKQEPLDSLNDYIYNDSSMEVDNKETFQTNALLEGPDNQEEQYLQEENIHDQIEQCFKTFQGKVLLEGLDHQEEQTCDGDFHPIKQEETSSVRQVD